MSCERRAFLRAWLGDHSSPRDTIALLEDDVGKAREGVGPGTRISTTP